LTSALLTFFGFALYALLHSALLTEWSRTALTAALGQKAFGGLFRLGYALQAIVLLLAYLVCVARLPNQAWGQAGYGLAALLWSVRLAALALIARCVASCGAAKFLGWEQLRAWWRGEPIPGDGVETGQLVLGGVYRWVRHPMYAAGLVALWAEPSWSANQFAFTLAASLYLVLGSLHEERRLLRFYGRAYREYMARTPRFVPRPWAPR